MTFDFCQTYIYAPLLTQVIISLALYFGNKICNLVIAHFLPNSTNSKVNTFGMSVATIGSIIARIMFFINSKHFFYSIGTFREMTSTVPGFGWSMDMIGIMIIMWYTIINYIEFDSGHTVKNLLKMFILNPFQFVIHWMLIQYSAKEGKSNRWKLASLFWINVVIVESYFWIQSVARWSRTHCFLDDFLLGNSPARQYVFISIMLTNVVLLSFFIDLSDSWFVKIFFGLLSFYNTTICIGLYILYVIYIKTPADTAVKTNSSQIGTNSLQIGTNSSQVETNPLHELTNN
jgi:hypothetical protein